MNKNWDRLCENLPVQVPENDDYTFLDKPKEKVYTLSPEDRDWLIAFLEWNLGVFRSISTSRQQIEKVLDKLQKM